MFVKELANMIQLHPNFWTHIRARLQGMQIMSNSSLNILINHLFIYKVFVIQYSHINYQMSCQELKIKSAIICLFIVTDYYKIVDVINTKTRED
jgi:hypothetical protein